MSNSSGQLFISKLVKETCSSSVEEDTSEVSSEVLSRYFEQKTKDGVEFEPIFENFIDKNNLQYIMLIKNENSRCFRVEFNGQCVDFPENWSIFDDLHRKDYLFSENEVSGPLVEVMKSFFVHEGAMWICSMKGNIFFILSDKVLEQVSDVDQWLKGFFGQFEEFQEVS